MCDLFSQYFKYFFSFVGEDILLTRSKTDSTIQASQKYLQALSFVEEIFLELSNRFQIG